jgi:DNA-directed RNA polymerase omega subunit
VAKDTKKGLRSLAFGLMPGHNKYELVIVAAREARRMNEMARLTGEPLAGKVTALSLERVLDGEVPFAYEEPSPKIPVETEL